MAKDLLLPEMPPGREEKQSSVPQNGVPFVAQSLIVTPTPRDRPVGKSIPELDAIAAAPWLILVAIGFLAYAARPARRRRNDPPSSEFW